MSARCGGGGGADADARQRHRISPHLPRHLHLPHHHGGSGGSLLPLADARWAIELAGSLRRALLRWLVSRLLACCLATRARLISIASALGPDLLLPLSAWPLGSFCGSLLGPVGCLGGGGLVTRGAWPDVFLISPLSWRWRRPFAWVRHDPNGSGTLWGGVWKPSPRTTQLLCSSWLAWACCARVLDCLAGALCGWPCLCLVLAGLSHSGWGPFYSRARKSRRSASVAELQIFPCA